MTSMKRFIALVMVAMMLVCAMAFGTSAAEDVDYTDAAQKLASINIMKGDTSGNLMLDSGVTRYQAALFFVQALTGETTVEKWNQDKQSAVFSDVPEYGTAIDYANGIGLIRGRGNGIYGYNDPIIYQDMLVLAVRALGYETDDMTYPQGYILAAKKLGLTENLATGITNSKALTRGETAQIIWDMLNTYVAVKDPVTDKVLYPNDYSISDALLGAGVERTTLLEDSGFSQCVIEGEIVEYNKAESSKDVSYVVLDNGLEIACSDLGITPRTNPSTFLGLPVTLYVDSESIEDFRDDYDIVAEDSEASIIFANMLEFTEVQNIGDEGNIKVTESTNGDVKVTLGADTFSMSKYEFDLRVLSEDGWVSEDFSVLFDAFYFADKEYKGENSYGEIGYAVVENDEDAEFEYKVIMLYKPYEFGQYFSRTMRYQPLVSDESFIVIGKYDEEAIIFGNNNTVSSSSFENVDGDYTYFVEFILGSDKKFDSSITSVSKKDGEASREAKISGGSVRSGDFIFYYYNELDNVLTVGKNCGGLKSGVLKSYSSSKETVKIGDATYEYGFSGAYESDLPVFSDHDFSGDYISNIADGNNAEYVMVDDRVLFVQIPLNPSNHRVKHNYVVTTTDPENMAELLGMEVDKYEKELTEDGVYVAESGNMQIAVLNTSNGKWGLAEVAQYEYGSFRSSTGMYHNNYNHEDAEWANVVNMAEGIENFGVFGDRFNGYDKYAVARDALLKGGLHAVRANKSGVYNLCVMFHPDDYGMINNGKNTDGVYFSDNAPKTNDLKAVRSETTDPARVTLNANTVVVVIDRDGNVGVRVGIQGEANSIVLENVTESVPAYLYSATSKLIVLQLPIGVNFNYNNIKNADGGVFDVAEWEGEAAAGSDETYYVGLNGSSVEYERLDDGSYELTVSGLYNLRTMRSVSAIKLSVEDLDETDIEDVDLTGTIIKMEKNGKLVISDDDIGTALTKAVNMRYDYSSTDDERYHEITSGVEFVDDSSITVTIGDYDLDKKEAVSKINVTVATLDVTDIDWEEFDKTDIAYAVEYDEDNIWGVGSTRYSASKTDKYYAYELAEISGTESITEPVAGVLDQYIIDTIGEELLVAAVDGEYYDDAASVCVELVACGQFDEDTGVVNLYVLKFIAPFAE